MTTFSRARYIKRIVTQFLSNGECVAQWSAVIKGVCDGLLWIETRGWENSCDREGAVLICNALTEAWLCAEEEMKKTWSPGLAFKFLGVDRFRIFFNVMYMLPGQCLWSVGAKVSEDTRFWEDRFCECEGDASCLLLEGLLASRKGTEPLVVDVSLSSDVDILLTLVSQNRNSLRMHLQLHLHGLLLRSLPGKNILRCLKSYHLKGFMAYLQNRCPTYCRLRL
ncbi:hypothetical protein BCR33DRAFT_719781 [Rhizoclosmatium globosum]|uniref:Uncharacterized protein n=1 Tax=Rhizoclosmatium globosum TaxID=329046 RepID=A0A1Y2BYZ2_9FUNG|nr:hypothetical protein BCR33DRAFT_719781 [Rhizoclosmatium globosum]|eukprot:ORY39980.1 hypothetical protein BCR33DRAFT_719781 [Rhizoclosmatium globosum]